MSDEPDLKSLDLSGKIVIGKQIDWGGYSDISQGTLITDAGQIEIVIKALRVRRSGSTISAEERLRKRFFREVLLWRALQHPNIVPLLGFTMLPDGLPALVSPWYVNGNVLRYLESHPEANRQALVIDVAEGLTYLHSIPVAHGDLKGENVLVNADGRASLCDFGMSQFIDEASRINGFTTTSGNAGGTDRFMCPELLEDGPKSTATDIWAFACLIVQILTDEIPYQQITRKHAIPLAIIRGDPPMTNSNGILDPKLWGLISRCWNLMPNERPTASEIALHLKPSEAPLSLLESLRRLNLSQRIKSHHMTIGFTRFSQDGEYLAVSSHESTISIWKVEKGSILLPELKTLSIADSILNLAWCPSQYLLLVTTSISVEVWSVETGHSLFCDVGGAADWLSDGISFTYVNDSSIFVQHLDQLDMRKREVVLPGSQVIKLLNIQPSPCCLVFTIFERTVYATVFRRNATKIEFQVELPGVPTEASLSNDGRFVLISYHYFLPELWVLKDPDADLVELSFSCRYGVISWGLQYRDVIFGGHNDELILALTSDGVIYVWDRDTQKLLHWFRVTRGYHGGSISLKQNCSKSEDILLAVGDPNASIQIWSVSSAESIDSGTTKPEL